MTTRKQDIEAAALRLFAERGVDRVSMRDIAEAVGIREGGLYKHIRSKEDLAAGVFIDAYRTFGAELRQALQPAIATGDPAAGISAIVATIYAAFDRDPVLLRYLLISQHDHLPTIALGADNPVEVAGRFIAAQIASGALPDQDPEIALALTMGVALQPLVNAIYGRLPTPVAGLVPIIAAAALAALGGASHATSIKKA